MTHAFPSLRDVIEMHSVLVDTFGGTPGIRDEGLLESALMRPQVGYYDGLIQEADALMESLANNHPFFDGNKRVAFFVTDAFLRLNGRFIDCNNIEAYDFFMGLFETGSFRFSGLEAWLRNYLKSPGQSHLQSQSSGDPPPSFSPQRESRALYLNSPR